MKKFIAKLYGATEHASAKEIKGQKSSGREDDSGYNHWQLVRDSDGYSGTNESREW